MIRALSLAAERPYQSKFDPDRGSEAATTFKLGTLDASVMGMIRDSGTKFTVATADQNDAVDTTVNRYTMYFLACQFGLRGWDNLADNEGKPVPFRQAKRTLGGKSYTVVERDSLNRLPSDVIAELGQEIMRDNELDEAQAGN